MSPENKAHYESEKEAIHLLLTRIGDEIYSTVDACKIAYEMWIAIERLQQGESLNIQDVKTNLFWVFGKFTSHVGESMESYYSRFYKMMNEMIRNNLTVATMQVNVQFLQQLQPKWSRSNASTKFKGKEIAKPITPPSKSASEEDSDPKQAQRDKDMQKNLTLITKYFKKIYKPTNNNLRTSLNSRNKNVDTSLRYTNDNQIRQFGNQRTVTVVGARETVCSQIDEQELEAHYSFMAKIQEVPTVDSGTDTKPLKQVQYNPKYNLFANKRHHFEQPKSISNTCEVEKVDSNDVPDSPDICDNDIQTDQNAVECEDERVVLANLIGNLKLDVNENKNIQRQFKKVNTSLAHELEECKSILTKTIRTLGESDSIWDSCLIALQNKQTGLERSAGVRVITAGFGIGSVMLLLLRHVWIPCKELLGFKYRHDMVRDALFDICRRVVISTKKEAPVNFLTDPLDGRLILRQPDVLVFGWVSRKHMHGSDRDFSSHGVE
ncbi:hypothetical protein Tco_1228873 [Tanacetum coccineum]